MLCIASRPVTVSFTRESFIVSFAWKPIISILSLQAELLVQPFYFVGIHFVIVKRYKLAVIFVVPPIVVNIECDNVLTDIEVDAAMFAQGSGRFRVLSFDY